MSHKNLLAVNLLTVIFVLTPINEMKLLNFLFKKHEKKSVVEKELKNRIYNHESLKSNDFERFILIKGINLKSVENKLKDYGQLPAKGNTYRYKFSKAKIGNWAILKMPIDFDDYYSYHNLAYWFLGFPPEDENYAEKTIALAIKNTNKESYILYNDYFLSNQLKLEDQLFGVFENDEKFILSIPFDEFKESNNSNIKSYNEFLKYNVIELNTIKSKKLVYTEFEVLFNEK